MLSIWAQTFWCVWLHLSRQHQAGFCYLTALQHPVSKPLCRMAPQGMVFVWARAKATTFNPPTFYQKHFILTKNQTQIGLHTSGFTDLIQIRDRAFSEALEHSKECGNVMMNLLWELYNFTNTDLNMNKSMVSKTVKITMTIILGFMKEDKKVIANVLEMA